MNRYFLTAAITEESEKTFNAFLESLKKMEPSEIVSKYGENFLWAIITTVIGIAIAKWVLNIIMRYVEKSGLAHGATKFIRGVTAFVLYFLVIITGASILGIPVTSVLAIFSIFTLAFSLAIKDVLALFASGITILASKPFNAGDFVEIPEEGISGFAADVGLIHTHIFTADNKEIIIPNSIVAANTIINYSKIGLRRLDAIFSIGHGEDFEKAKAIIRRVVDDEPLIEKDRDIFIHVTAMNPNGTDIICKVYVKWDSYEVLRCTLNEKVKIAFDENGIEVPYNQIDVHMK